MMSKIAKKLAIGTMFAAAAGYVTGILTAPKSGSETRKDLKNAASKALIEGEKKLKELHSELDKVIGKTEAKLGEMGGKAKQEVQAKLDIAKTAKEKVRSLLAALHEGDADDKELKATLKEAKAALNHLVAYFKK